jgi:hypothetical protein
MAFTVKPTRKQTGKVTTGDRYGAVDYSAPSVAAPAAPAPTYGAPSTEDSQYRATVELAALNRDQQLAAIAGQGERLRLNYGYLDDAKTLDPNNPFGQAQLLKRNYDQTKAGTTSSYAARGQQMSGAYNRMQGANLFNYQQGDDRLQKSYDDARASLINQATGVGNDYASSKIGADADALARAIAARNGVPQQAPQSSDRLLSSTKRRDGKTVNRYASGRVAVF